MTLVALITAIRRFLRAPSRRQSASIDRIVPAHGLPPGETVECIASHPGDSANGQGGGVPVRGSVGPASGGVGLGFLVGFGVALMFLFFGAPDLAMTQFLVETLTVILLVLVLTNRI